jgi:hypothetical protein
MFDIKNINSLVTVGICLLSSTSWQWLDSLYRCMIKYHEAACTVFLMMNTWFFEICRRQYSWIKSFKGKKVCILLVLLQYKYILRAECRVLFVKPNGTFGNRCVLGGSYCSSIRTFPCFIKPVYTTVFLLSCMPKACPFSALAHNGIFPTDAVLLYSVHSEHSLIFRSEVMFHVKCVWDGEGKLYCGSNDDSLRYWLSNNFSRVVIIRLVNKILHPQSRVRDIAWWIEKHVFHSTYMICVNRHVLTKREHFLGRCFVEIRLRMKLLFWKYIAYGLYVTLSVSSVHDCTES